MTLKRVAVIGTRVTAIGTRLTAIGTRVTAIGTRITAIGTRVAAIATRVEAKPTCFEALQPRRRRALQRSSQGRSRDRVTVFRWRRSRRAASLTLPGHS